MIDTRRAAGLYLVLAGLLALGLTLAVVLWPLIGSSRVDQDAMDRWRAKEPTAYSFLYVGCVGQCNYCPTRITVRVGRVTDAVLAGGHGPGCADRSLEAVPTIDGVFDLDAQVRGEADTVEVTYDPTWGFPARIHGTCPPNVSDCGTDHTVSEFRVLTG